MEVELVAILPALSSIRWERAPKLALNDLMMWSELSLSAFKKNSAVIGGMASGAATLAVAWVEGAEVSISTWSVVRAGLEGASGCEPPAGGIV